MKISSMKKVTYLCHIGAMSFVVIGHVVIALIDLINEPQISLIGYRYISEDTLAGQNHGYNRYEFVFVGLIHE